MQLCPAQHPVAVVQASPSDAHVGFVTQTPSAQTPVQHWLLDVQTSPFGRQPLTHWLSSQCRAPQQSLLVAQTPFSSGVQAQTPL